MKKSFLIIISLICSIHIFAQKRIEFKNSSFEGTPQPGIFDKDILIDWANIIDNESSHSTFDIQPGFFNVNKEPIHGNSFVGIIARENGSTEAICQKLLKPIQKDTFYQLTIFLSKSPNYVLVNPVKEDEIEDFLIISPLRLNVWGSNSQCSKDELLYRSKIIEHTDWYQYEITFTPSMSYTFLTFEADFSNKNNTFPGNILLDAINLDKYEYGNYDKYDISLHYEKKISDLQKLPSYILIETIVDKNKTYEEYCSNIHIIKDVFEFKKNIFDVTYYLNSIEANKLESLKNSLKIVGAEEIYEIVSRYDNLMNNRTDKPEDKKFLQNFKTLIQEANDKVTLDIILNEFVRENKEEIILEMASY